MGHAISSGSIPCVLSTEHSRGSFSHFTPGKWTYSAKTKKQ
jgi:hypothetical protein